MTPESEILARFRELQPKLAYHWERIIGLNSTEKTVVIIPSLTLDLEELRKIKGVDHYEERLLFFLMLLRQPRSRLIYVSSRRIHPLIIDYYLNLLTGVPVSHARRRLTLLSTEDASTRPLTEKVLERPRLLARIRHAIVSPETSLMLAFNVTPLERRLAVELGIPLFGPDPDLNHLGTKTGNKRIFRESGVPCARGEEDLETPQDLAAALARLKMEEPALERAVIKLNEGFSGEGNAVFEYHQGDRDEKTASSLEKTLLSRLPSSRLQSRQESWDGFALKLGRMKGIVEEFLQAETVYSPSAQLRINPRGTVEILSTHDQVLGGPDGQVFLGCRFPASIDYRKKIQKSAIAIGEHLSTQGVQGRLGIDFMALENGQTDPQVYAVEINLRMGGTTHPYGTLEFLTDGFYDPVSGNFYSRSRRPKYYVASDNICEEFLKGLLPEDLLEIITLCGLHFHPAEETGTVFHMVGAVSEFGKLGMTCIGDSPEEADEIYQRTLKVLGEEVKTPPEPPGGYTGV